MENGVLGGSFRPAPDCDFTETAESCGIRRAHPGCPRERSSQSAKNRPSARWSGRRVRGGARCGRRPRSRSSVDSRMVRCPDPAPGPRSEAHRVRSGGPEGEEEGRPWKMAFWEDRSVPHPTATSPESRNHAELVEFIRGARANDPPRAPKTDPPLGGRAARPAGGLDAGVGGGGEGRRGNGARPSADTARRAMGDGLESRP